MENATIEITYKELDWIQGKLAKHILIKDCRDINHFLVGKLPLQKDEPKLHKKREQ